MGKELFVSTKIFDLLKKVGVIIVTVSLLFLNLGVISLVYAYAAVPFVIYLFEVYYLYRKGVRIRIGTFDRQIGKDIMSLSVWLFIVVIGEMFVVNITPSILAARSTTEQIAIFAIGLTLYNYVYSFAGAINGFFLPKVYRARQNDNREQITTMSTNVSAIQMAVVGLFVGGIFSVGKDFIYLWVGEAFDMSYYVSCLLLVPALITLCQPIEGTELFVTNNFKYRSYMLICNAIVSVILSITLCPQYGALGAAFGISISTLIFTALGMNIVYYKLLKSNVWAFFVLFVKYVIVISLSCIALRFISELIKDMSWMNLILKGIVFVAIYAVLCYGIALPAFVKENYINKLCYRIFSKK